MAQSAISQSRPYEHVGYGAVRTLRWAYSNGFTSATADTLLNSDIINIIMTPKGSWRWLPRFGSDIHKLVMEPNDAVAGATGTRYILQALAEWERRITNVRVGYRVNPENPHELNFKVLYDIANTNQTGNLVVSVTREIQV